MSTVSPTASGYDVFLSHGSPDKPLVRTLRAELARLGLNAFLDECELVPGENWTLRLSQELRQSRALARLVIARAIGDRRGEGIALGNLGFAYAALGQVERAIGYCEQALRIGQEIKDPRIIRIVTVQLERLRGGVPAEKPKKSGGFWRRLFGGGK